MQTIDTEEQYEEAVMQSKSSWTQKNRKDIEDSLESPSTDARGVLAVSGTFWGQKSTSMSSGGPRRTIGTFCDAYTSRLVLNISS